MSDRVHLETTYFNPMMKKLKTLLLIACFLSPLVCPNMIEANSQQKKKCIVKVMITDEYIRTVRVDSGVVCDDDFLEKYSPKQNSFNGKVLSTLQFYGVNEKKEIYNT